MPARIPRHQVIRRSNQSKIIATSFRVGRKCRTRGVAATTTFYGQDFRAQPRIRPASWRLLLWQVERLDRPQRSSISFAESVDGGKLRDHGALRNGRRTERMAGLGTSRAMMTRITRRGALVGVPFFGSGIGAFASRANSS